MYRHNHFSEKGDVLSRALLFVNQEARKKHTLEERLFGVILSSEYCEHRILKRRSTFLFPSATFLHRLLAKRHVEEVADTLISVASVLTKELFNDKCERLSMGERSLFKGEVSSSAEILYIVMSNEKENRRTFQIDQ